MKTKGVWLSMVMLALLALFGCDKAIKGSIRVDKFVEALKDERYKDAYQGMCPEYRAAYSEKQFVESVRAFPYLQGMRGVDCTGWTTYGVILERGCIFETKYGEMHGGLFARSDGSKSCIISMDIVGLPAIGFGIHMHRAQDQAHEQPAPKETVSD